VLIFAFSLFAGRSRQQENFSDDESLADNASVVSLASSSLPEEGEFQQSQPFSPSTY